jgi:hypothetical protein
MSGNIGSHSGQGIVADPAEPATTASGTTIVAAAYIL